MLVKRLTKNEALHQKDRIIYKVQEDIVTVIIVSAMGHYSDK
jgi:toxin YoeB